MAVSDLSSNAQDMLKVVWGLQEWSDAPVTPSTIAAKTGLRLSTVSGAVARLTEKGFLAHSPYGAVALTDRGRAYALAMVRRHRLLESFLVDMLGYRWDEVHDEAENLEHAVSDLMIERIDAVLGRPQRDPHGDPIPQADGTVVTPDAVRLSTISGGADVVVERISDADSTLLQFFSAQGIGVGVRLTVADGPPFSGALDVTIGDGPVIPLGPSATDAVWVSRVD